MQWKRIINEMCYVISSYRSSISSQPQYPLYGFGYHINIVSFRYIRTGSHQGHTGSQWILLHVLILFSNINIFVESSFLQCHVHRLNKFQTWTVTYRRNQPTNSIQWWLRDLRAVDCEMVWSLETNFKKIIFEIVAHVLIEEYWWTQKFRFWETATQWVLRLHFHFMWHEGVSSIMHLEHWRRN